MSSTTQTTSAALGSAGGPAPTPAAPRRRPRNRRADGSRPSVFGSWVSRILLIIVLCLFLLPLYWMVVSALKSPEELAAFPPTLIPREWHFENFAEAVSVMPFWRFFMNTVIITASVVVLSVVSNFVVAYGFACIQWPGRDKLFLVVLATLFLPFPVTLIPMFDLWANLGLVNTWGPLIIPALFAGGFYTFLLRQFMLQIPQDMLAAARVDGASEWRIAWSIVFPTARPAITVVAIFSAVGTWNDFMGPLLYLQDPAKQTLSIGMQAFRTVNAADVQFNLLMAASLIVILPLILLFFFFQRYFISGISLGGFK